ncbi:hypothetical protein H2204_011927 [Knufia peltigerae]|uniref:Uncharacterized protein n=1 Tax=Knufia peltigerae TaxID=1002370 RepID=A0AA38XT73_9EURO|nr:hypothetical protein H2204_011927 [Knufia peltigerae]
MPEDILFELNTAIDSRYQVAENLAWQGNADQGHTHMIYTLMRILHLFWPRSPQATPQMVGQGQLYAAVPSIACAQDWRECPSPTEGTYQPVGQQQQQQPPPPPPPLPQPVFFSPGAPLIYANPMPEQQLPPPQPVFSPGIHQVYTKPMPEYFEFVPGNQQYFFN